MKKSELRKLIREILSEQIISQAGSFTGPTMDINAVNPVLNKEVGGDHWNVHCPAGSRPIDPDYSQVVNLGPVTVQPTTPPIQQAIMVSGCVKSKPDQREIPPKSPGPNYDMDDPLGDAPVGGGGFGTANLGGLPSN